MGLSLPHRYLSRLKVRWILTRHYTGMVFATLALLIMGFAIFIANNRHGESTLDVIRDLWRFPLTSAPFIGVETWQ